MSSVPATTAENRTLVLILMGVSGAGKTTVGTRLAEALGWEFVDGDAFHPEANVVKMSRGEPLTDEDRWPWLHAIRDFIHERLEKGDPAIVACSALKATYREVLLEDNDGAQIIHLKGSYDLIRDRMKARTDHFFDAELLDSQFEVLEEPTTEAALTVNVDASPTAIARTICRELPALGEASEK